MHISIYLVFDRHVCLQVKAQRLVQSMEARICLKIEEIVVRA